MERVSWKKECIEGSIQVRQDETNWDILPTTWKCFKVFVIKIIKVIQGILLNTRFHGPTEINSSAVLSKKSWATIWSIVCSKCDGSENHHNQMQNCKQVPTPTLTLGLHKNHATTCNNKWTVVSRHRKNFHYFCWSNTPWRKTTGKQKRPLNESLLSSNVDPMGSPPKVPLWQLCQETNTFFPLLVASNHQVGDQMIKRGILPWLKQQENQGSEELPWQCHLLKKESIISTNRTLPNNLPSWCFFESCKKNCSTCHKSCYECNNRVLTNRAFNKVWKNMPSLICNVLPKARLEAMQVSDKKRPMCGAKGLYLPIRDTVMFRMQPKT